MNLLGGSAWPNQCRRPENAPRKDAQWRGRLLSDNCPSTWSQKRWGAPSEEPQIQHHPFWGHLPHLWTLECRGEARFSQRGQCPTGKNGEAAEVGQRPDYKLVLLNNGTVSGNMVKLLRLTRSFFGGEGLKITPHPRQRKYLNC